MVKNARSKMRKLALAASAAAALAIGLALATGEGAPEPAAAHGQSCGEGIMRLLIPDGAFHQACHNHDGCYTQRAVSRYTCDVRFLADMQNACVWTFQWWNPQRGVCLTQALTYYHAVRYFGCRYWPPC